MSRRFDHRPAELHVAVVVATLGRSESTGQLLDRLAEQTQSPSQVVLSVESDADLPAERSTPFELDVIMGPRGLPAQRNRGIRRLKPDTDLVVFYDDDFVPTVTSIADIAAFFAAHHDVVGAEGHVLADGATTEGVSYPDALRIVEAAEERRTGPDLSIQADTHGLYGCNMAYCYDAIRGMSFDELLPLYAWFEDLDFSARVGKRIVETKAFAGVHRGEKSGRERGERLGYSQLANPYYLACKGTLSWSICIRSSCKHLLINHLRSLRPEHWIDRRGRAKGNRRAAFDLLRGVLHPGRIVDL